MEEAYRQELRRQKKAADRRQRERRLNYLITTWQQQNFMMPVPGHVILQFKYELSCQRCRAKFPDCNC
ncbi:hypothetical protein ACFLZY_01970 [Patescibacteria group bacterium]